MEKIGMITLGYNVNDDEIYTYYQLKEVSLPKLIRDAQLDQLSLEGGIAFNSIDEYIESVVEGNTPSDDYVFYANGDGVSLLLDGYELGICDCIKSGSGRG